jgi:hypothetical protein
MALAMADPCALIRSRNLKTYLVGWNWLVGWLVKPTWLVGWLLTPGDLPCMIGYGQINRR